MRITDRQIEILEKFSCERLHSNPNNLSLIKKFYSKRGSGLVDYLNKNGSREDASDMYPESWTHIYMNQAEHMDAILYCTGGIHFVFA